MLQSSASYAAGVPIYDSVVDTVGRTPLIRLSHISEGLAGQVTVIGDLGSMVLAPPWHPGQEAPPSAIGSIFDTTLFEVRAVQATDASERNPILEIRGYDPVPDGIAVFRFDDRD